MSYSLKFLVFVTTTSVLTSLVFALPSDPYPNPTPFFPLQSSVEDNVVSPIQQCQGSRIFASIYRDPVYKSYLNVVFINHSSIEDIPDTKVVLKPGGQINTQRVYVSDDERTIVYATPTGSGIILLLKVNDITLPCMQ